jgi:hypothetical protein
VQPVTAVLLPVKVRSRRPPRVPYSDTRLTGRATFPRESSGRKSSAAGERCLSRSDRSRRASNCAGRSKANTGGSVDTPPRQKPRSGLWGSRLIRLMRKATGAGTHRGYGPASPPDVEVTARVDGALTQSREGLDRSPDQVVGQGLLYNQCSWEVRGCGRDWRIGPDSVEGRDNITLPEQRARGPRWSRLSEPEAGRYRIRAGGVRRRDISDEGHVKPGSARGYADLALKLGRFGGRAWLMATHLGLEPYWRKADVRNLRGALETSPCEPD